MPIGFTFRSGGGAFKNKVNDNAALAADVLEEIEREKGCVTPEVLLERSTPDNAPLHHLFTWEDDEAAHKYRIEEARRIIKAVIVTQKESAGELLSFPVYYNATDGAGNRGYYSRVRVLNDRALFLSAVRNLTERIDGMETVVKDLLDMASDEQKPHVKKVNEGIRTMRKAANTIIA